MDNVDAGLPHKSRGKDDIELFFYGKPSVRRMRCGFSSVSEQVAEVEAAKEQVDFEYLQCLTVQLVPIIMDESCVPASTPKKIKNSGTTLHEIPFIQAQLLSNLTQTLLLDVRIPIFQL